MKWKIVRNRKKMREGERNRMAETFCVKERERKRKSGRIKRTRMKEGESEIYSTRE